MTIIKNYKSFGLGLILCALIISTSVKPAAAQNSSACGVLLAKFVSLNSAVIIDSFDSSDPAKSTNGLYDPAKRQTNGNLCLLNSTNSDLRNAYVYGNVQFSGPLIKNTTNVHGTISTPFNTPLPNVSDPTWDAGTFTQYAGGANPPVTSPANSFMAAGTIDNPTRIKVNGDFSVPGGKTFSIVSATGTDAYVQVWVTGKFTQSGSGKITQDPLVHITWIVDRDIAANGDSYSNWSQKAANLSFVGVNMGRFTLSGVGNFVAAMEGPSRDITISGSVALSGGLVGSTLTMSGSSAFHYDEALP